MDGENWIVEMIGMKVECQLAVLEENNTPFGRGMLEGSIQCLSSAIIDQCVNDNLI
jgi:hypothetical protein